MPVSQNYVVPQAVARSVSGKANQGHRGHDAPGTEADGHEQLSSKCKKPAILSGRASVLQGYLPSERHYFYTGVRQHQKLGYCREFRLSVALVRTLRGRKN
jgi:hypothetical protein